MVNLYKVKPNFFVFFVWYSFQIIILIHMGRKVNSVQCCLMAYWGFDYHQVPANECTGW